MECCPYFQNHWKAYPSRNYHASPSIRFIPVQQPQQHVQKTPSSKTVSIPIHFVSTEKKNNKDRAESAVKIQRAFRGFMVRKCFKKLVEVKAEVDEIERRVLLHGGELMRRDEKERLKVHETLMGLLLRLDSVKGVDDAVRECRKGYIKKVIAMQERVDAIVNDGEEVVAMQENVDAIASDGEKVVSMQGNVDGTENGCEKVVAIAESGDAIANDGEEVEEKEENGERKEVEERKVVERIVKENERMMMGLMEEWYKRNEMQTRMLESLYQRVERLERAFLHDKLRRKKNKQKNCVQARTCEKKQ